MISNYMRRILKFGPLIGDTVVSVTGSFAFMRGFRLVASGQEAPDAKSSLRADGGTTKQFAGIGAELFLLAFVASEALATAGALKR
jgi:hypothetical protein